jgi:alpha-tubulin suppressor-like RCC1 family protein
MLHLTSEGTICVPVHGMGVGFSGSGQLGINSTTGTVGYTVRVPIAVFNPAGVTAWTQVSAGGSHTCGIASNSSAMYCWGAFRECGGVEEVPRARTTWASPMLHLTNEGTTCVPVYCMGVGGNGYGQLGINSTTSALVPSAVFNPAGVTAWTQVSAGYYQTCGIASSGSAIYCWGACRECVCGVGEGLEGASHTAFGMHIARINYAASD